MATNPSTVRRSEFTQAGIRWASQTSVFFSITARKLSCFRSASRNFSFGITQACKDRPQTAMVCPSGPLLDHLWIREEEMIEVIVHQQHAEHHYKVALVSSQVRHGAHSESEHDNDSGSSEKARVVSYHAIAPYQ